MSSLIKGFQILVRKYPITRGMITYSIVWPTSNLVQQFMDKSFVKYDYAEAMRFAALGTFVTAPTIYGWVKLAGWLVKGTKLRHAILKALIELALFAPVGQCQFYVGINLLEGRSLRESLEEFKCRLPATWKTFACYWPFIQTINFAYVAEKNRVIVVALASLVWTVFLSYMHHHNIQSIPDILYEKFTNEYKQKMLK